MTFAQKVKTELCSIEDAKSCCEKAELYGLLLFGKTFGDSGISIQTEHEDVADRINTLLSKLYGVKASQKLLDRSDGRKADYLSVDNKNDLKKIFTSFGQDGKTVALRINRADIENECCATAFLRGVFLVCGSIVDPEKDYHMEFVSSHLRLGQDLADFMTEIGLEPKTIVRKGNFVVYFKDSSQIEDTLTFMGAVQNSLELMNVKVYKDLRNKVNRVTNCETANIGKTVNAAGLQLEAIEKLQQSKGYGSLPEELREIAEIRLANPDASLRELAAIAGISRSGVNHRLNKLIEIAKIDN